MTTQGDFSSRLGVFFFFDADGIVDDYVTVMLEDMAKNLSELVVVSNGSITPDSFAKLARFTDNIIIRENSGLDVWAYKAALDNYGWERLSQFHEVVLFNSTIMGPVHPFVEMFQEMDSRSIDFWGITWFHEVPFDPFGTTPEGYIPRHIQSHFMAYRRSLVSSQQFQDYWDNLPQISSYAESVGMHEAPFTQRFERLGFKSDVYVNTEDLEGFTYQPVLMTPRELISNRRCPIFKRRSFFHGYDDTLSQSVGNATVELYEYLRDHTEYDTSLIWQNLLRTCDLSDLVRNLKLTYVLPTESVPIEPQGLKVALFLHIYYIDLLESTLEYAQSMPEGSDIYITVGSEEKAAVVRQACETLPFNVEVRLVQNRGRDVSALLVGLHDVVGNYDLVCFAHDKKVTQLVPNSIGDGFAFKCFENLLASREFVKNVISTFDREPRLGVLMPSPPNHAEYFPSFTFGWGPNFENTRKLLRHLGVNVPLDPQKGPIAPLGSFFWFRTDALYPLFNSGWGYESFPAEPLGVDGTMSHAIERAHAYVGQGRGYFSGWLYSDSFARIELTNLSYYVQELTRGAARHWMADTLMNMRASMNGTAGTLYQVKAAARRWLPSGLFEPARQIYTGVRSTYRKARRKG